MRKYLTSIAVILLAMTGSIAGQPNARAPHIGYLYPAGGQRGTEITVTAGGQNLRGGRQVHISGTGVRAEVLQFCPPLLNLGAEERMEIQRRFREAFITKIEELTGKPLADLREKAADKSKSSDAKPTEKSKDAAASQTPEATLKIPEHPLLDNLDKRSLRELVNIRMSLFPDRNKLQMNRQIAEGVQLKITIAPDAEPGSRELRIQTAA